VPAVAAPLRRFVKEVRAISFSGRRDVEYLPDGTTSLVVRWRGRGDVDAGVRGPCTRAHYKTVDGVPLAVRVVFSPGGAYPFFGVPVCTISDRLVALEELWGGDAAWLLARVDDEPAGAVRAVEAALTDRLRRRPYDPAGAIPARAAAARIAGGQWSIDEVARDLGVSGRHLRRSFQAAVGLGPKTFARIMRFQRARAASGDWAAVARASGYFDQAHLATEFRRFLGAPPTAASRHAEATRRPCG
jgi:AraC-like DNA-binding protein